MNIASVAISRSLNKLLDYEIPTGQILQPGIRVEIPLGKRQTVVGWVVVCHNNPSPFTLKPILNILDEEPLFTPDLWQLLIFASDYYHHPLGMVLKAATPKALRQKTSLSLCNAISITEEGLHQPLNRIRGKIQRRALEVLKGWDKNNPLMLSDWENKSQTSRTILNILIKKNWAELCHALPHKMASELPLQLNDEQLTALKSIQASEGFQVFLLEGITGSGKTEVYLQAIDDVIQQGGQALVLVPEIGLTPQTISRFEKRFNVPVISLHSHLADGERAHHHLLAKQGIAKIVIGTRSAIFCPLPQLKLIIVDEEHDGSFKQQDSFSYSGRDLAIKRGQLLGIPVVLGSATPSIESHFNALKGRYKPLQLKKRAGGAKPPSVELIQVAGQKLESGLSQRLLLAIQERLHKKEQVVLFLNRRGFAPVLMCHVCSYVFHCNACDVNLILHQSSPSLKCHHCSHTRPIPDACGRCGAAHLIPLGIGTEKLESVLRQHFKTARLLRLDRDTTQTKTAFDEATAKIHAQEVDLIIGTQMLAKGHDFPNVTLVGVLDADYGLISPDYKALELLGQLLTQVAGRAGRAEKKGEVFIQTHFPDHPIFPMLFNEPYQTFLHYILGKRESAHLPPYRAAVNIRAESRFPGKPNEILKKLRLKIPDFVEVLGPITPSIAKKHNWHQGVLLLLSEQRSQLQKALESIEENIPEAKVGRLRWDVDPVEGM